MLTRNPSHPASEFEYKVNLVHAILHPQRLVEALIVALRNGGLPPLLLAGAVVGPSNLSSALKGWQEMDQG